MIALIFFCIILFFMLGASCIYEGAYIKLKTGYIQIKNITFKVERLN